MSIPLLIKYVGHDATTCYRRRRTNCLRRAGTEGRPDRDHFREPIGAPGGTNTMKIVKVGESRKP